MSKIRRNEPCPCGSGLKYKKCCLLNDSVPTPSSSPLSSSALKIEKNGKIEDIVTWLSQQPWGEWYVSAYLEHYTVDLKPGKNGLRSVEELHARSIMELAIFEGLVGSQTPLEMFIRQADLSPVEQKYYQDWLDRQVFSFFEVKEIELGQSLGVTDLITQRDYYIEENRGTYDLKTGMTLVVRLVPHQDYWMITGGVSSVFPRGFGDSFRESLAGKDTNLPPEKPTQYMLMEAGFLSTQLQAATEVRAEGAILEDNYDTEAAKHALGLFGQELEVSQVLDEYLQAMVGKSSSDTDMLAIQKKLPQVMARCSSQDQIERLLRLIKSYSSLISNEADVADKVGPIEKQLVKKLGDYVVKHRTFDSQTKQGQAEGKKLMNQWLDKPQKKFKFKTAREVILEERESLGNSEKKVSYSFFSFSDGMAGSGLSKHQSDTYNQAVNQLQDGQALEALEKLASLSSVAKTMRDVFRWYSNVGSALAQLGQLDKSKWFFQRSLEINPEYALAQDNLNNLADKKIRQKLSDQGLISLWWKLHQVRWSLDLKNNEQLAGLLIDFEKKTGRIKTQPPEFLRNMQLFLDTAVNKTVKLTAKREDIILKQVKELNQQLVTPDLEENELLVGIKDASAKHRLESEFTQIRLLHMVALAAGWVKVIITKGKTKQVKLAVTAKGKKWLRKAIGQQFDELLITWWSELNWTEIFDYASLGTGFIAQKMNFYQDTLVVYLQRLAQTKGFVSFEKLTQFHLGRDELDLWLSSMLMEKDVFVPLIRAGLIEVKNKKLLKKLGGVKNWDKLGKKNKQAYRLTPLGRVVWQALERELQGLVPAIVIDA